MKTYVVNIKFFQEIFQMDVKARSKSEAYKKAKVRLARRLFKESNLKNYSCTEWQPHRRLGALSGSANMVEFIDLGLPSGKKWAATNEGGYYTFDEAIEKFGKKSLPSKEDFRELINNCKSEWDDTRKGWVFTGPNGNSIFFPALGYRKKDGSTVRSRGSIGYYWSSSVGYEYGACGLYFDSVGVSASVYDRSYGGSVRFVQE